MLCALIMAGGKGTRFWPLSTEEKPKQFLKLIDDETMIQKTINRIRDIIPLERIFICTGNTYIDLVKEQVPDLPEKNIIVEPEGKNTAPCIVLSSIIIKKYYKNANILVLPSDHLIKDEEKFRNIILRGNSFLEKNNEVLITLGIKPTRPETNYGYIKYENKSIESKILKVESFVEKPSKDVAKSYLDSGNYLWNAGMFMWNVNSIINEFKKYNLEDYKSLSALEECAISDLDEVILDSYSKVNSISIDYAVLEKSKNIYVIPSDIGWDDIGNWDSIERYRVSDDNGNINIGDVNCYKGKNNLVVASSGKVIIDGLSDIYVIENAGNIVLGRKDNISRIKELRNAR